MGSISNVLPIVIWAATLITAEILEQLISWAFEEIKAKRERKAKAKRKRKR